VWGRATAAVPEVRPKIRRRKGRTDTTSGTLAGVDLGFARVWTTEQDLDRQVDALHRAELARCLRSGRTTRRSQGRLECQGK